MFEGSDDDGRENYGVTTRVYLEDGRYSITDENGHYHFDDLDPVLTACSSTSNAARFPELAPCADRMGTPAATIAFGAAPRHHVAQ